MIDWLPPTYRILYTEKLPYPVDFIEYIESTLNSYIDNNALFCSLDNDIIANVENVEYKDGKFAFWLNELKPKIFEKKNIHLESFYIKIEMDREIKDTVSISSVLKLEKVDG